MSRHLQVKVHDVLHEAEEFDASTVEAYIESWCNSRYQVVDVYVAPGRTNSPIILTIGLSQVSVDTAREIAREAAQAFAEQVSGVDVDQTVRDENIRLMTK